MGFNDTIGRIFWFFFSPLAGIFSDGGGATVCRVVVDRRGIWVCLNAGKGLQEL